MGHSGKDIDATLSWAEQQYRAALQKFTRLSPVASLSMLQQGDVMISSSGNIRVVLTLEKRQNVPFAAFLSRLKTNRITIENAESYIEIETEKN